MLTTLTELKLLLGRQLLPHETPKLRGFFGREFADQILLHHHLPDGRLLYSYPRVQFKVIDRVALLVGIDEGSELLSKLWLQVDQTRIGDEVLPVLETHLTNRRVTIGETDGMVDYLFLTPWLALNEANNRRYEQARSKSERVRILERVLVGNCLSFAKAFGYTVRERLNADCHELWEVPCKLKGVVMRGFLGRFRVNFELPDHLGIGKSVSRGFGTVEHVPTSI